MAKISSNPEGIEEHVLRLLVPSEIQDSFELKQIIENDKELLFDLVDNAIAEANNNIIQTFLRVTEVREI